MALSSGAEVVWCIVMIVVTSDLGRLFVSLVSKGVAKNIQHGPAF